jgi:hypothetical protein
LYDIFPKQKNFNQSANIICLIIFLEATIEAIDVEPANCMFSRNYASSSVNYPTNVNGVIMSLFVICTWTALLYQCYPNTQLAETIFLKKLPNTNCDFKNCLFINCVLKSLFFQITLFEIAIPNGSQVQELSLFVLLRYINELLRLLCV